MYRLAIWIAGGRGAGDKTRYPPGSTASLAGQRSRSDAGLVRHRRLRNRVRCWLQHDRAWAVTGNRCVSRHFPAARSRPRAILGMGKLAQMLSERLEVAI
jgi:hypothetical protein